MQGKVYGGLETTEDFFFVTANAWVKRSVLVEVGGFDERLANGGSEDLDLGWRILDIAIPTKFCEECRVDHPTKPQHTHADEASELVKKKFPKRYEYLKAHNQSRYPYEVC